LPKGESFKCGNRTTAFGCYFHIHLASIAFAADKLGGKAAENRAKAELDAAAAFDTVRSIEACTDAVAVPQWHDSLRQLL